LCTFANQSKTITHGKDSSVWILNVQPVRKEHDMKQIGAHSCIGITDSRPSLSARDIAQRNTPNSAIPAKQGTSTAINLLSLVGIDIYSTSLHETQRRLDKQPSLRLCVRRWSSLRGWWVGQMMMSLRATRGKHWSRKQHSFKTHKKHDCRQVSGRTLGHTRCFGALSPYHLALFNDWFLL
jgi:hypothetical protein